MSSNLAGEDTLLSVLVTTQLFRS